MVCAGESDLPITYIRKLFGGAVIVSEASSSTACVHVDFVLATIMSFPENSFHV